MRVCRAYNSHYEIIDYDLGDISRLEKLFSTYDRITHKYIPYYHYDEEKRILYIPRGCDANLVSHMVGRPVTYIPNKKPDRKCIFSVGNMPRDDYQRKMIRYLVGAEEFEGMKKSSQQVLSLPTRSGKTYVTIAAISILETRAIIIVNSDELRTQWKTEILKHTQLQESNVELISSTDWFYDIDSDPYTITERKEKYIFIVTHRSIYNTVKKYGGDVLNSALTKLQIGIKVIDEAHIEFHNTLRTDYFTNVWKTWYLTATFGRSESNENRIFQRAFDKVNKIAMSNPERKPSVVLFMIGFQTKPNHYVHQLVCYKPRGFDRYVYMNYELNEEPTKALDNEVKTILRMVIETKKLAGKILILAPSIGGCEHYKDIVEELYPQYSVCCHNSANRIEDFREYGVICATRQMLGTAITIPNLRVIINLEPTSSEVNLTQTIGRLDVYEGGLDTYYFYIVDTSFDKVRTIFYHATNILKKGAKEVIVRDDAITIHDKL